MRTRSRTTHRSQSRPSKRASRRWASWKPNATLLYATAWSTRVLRARITSKAATRSWRSASRRSRESNCCLLDLEAALLDHAAPFLQFAVDVSAKLLWRAGDRAQAAIGEELHHVGRGHRLFDLLV